MKRLLFILIFSAAIAHALGALLAGSANPGDWPVLIVGTTVFVFAPCTALALCILEGAV